MDARRAVTALIIVAILGLGVSAFLNDPTDEGPTPCEDVPRPSVDPTSDPVDRLEIWLSTPNGTRLATVEALIAATPDARRIGLREVDSLADGEGMLFVHGSDATWTYRTTDLSFPLDIVFAGRAGDIRAIHHAPIPGASHDDAYAGKAQYILQVPRGYTNRTGVGIGDCLAVPGSLRNAA